MRIIKTFIQDGSEELKLIADSSNDHFEYNTPTPSSVWIIAHNMNKRPSVTIVDSAGTEFEGDVTHVDDNNVIIEFSASFSGTAFFN